MDGGVAFYGDVEWEWYNIFIEDSNKSRRVVLDW